MFTDGEEERAVDGEEKRLGGEISLLIFLSRGRGSLSSFLAKLEVDNLPYVRDGRGIVGYA